MKYLSLMLFLIWPLALKAEPPIVGTYQGTKATERKGEKIALEITLEKQDSGYLLSGSGGYSSGRSAAPDFSGSSQPGNTPPYKFSFEDSFGNKGTALIVPTKTGIKFSATISEVEDPRCLPLYGEIALKRE